MHLEAVRTSETSVDNHFTWQYIPEDNSEHHTRRHENLKSHIKTILFHNDKCDRNHNHYVRFSLTSHKLQHERSPVQKKLLQKLMLINYHLLQMKIKDICIVTELSVYCGLIPDGSLHYSKHSAMIIYNQRTRPTACLLT
jgi:hypothetical protein